MKAETLNGFWVNWIAVITYCGFIFFLSCIRSPMAIPRMVYFDKILHFGAFFVLGILFYRAFGSLRKHMNKWVLVVLTFTSSLIFGVLIEVNQFFLAYRSAEAMDLTADILGCILGISICLLFFPNGKIPVRTK